MKVVFAALTALLGVTASLAYSAADKEKVIKDVTESTGWPKLNFMEMDEVTPEFLNSFAKKELQVLGNLPLNHFNMLDAQAIFLAVSAANGCELCLSFHSMALSGSDKISAEDVKKITLGGLPDEKTFLGPVTAAKFALARKGVFLPREKEHLKQLFGYGPQHLLEINYLVGQIEANNRVMVYLLAEGMELDTFLKPLTAFADTLYAEGKTEL